MPIYEYEREDGTVFEVMQKISDEPLEKCPDTGLRVKRLISRVVSHFKGNGFYQTDYNGGNASAGTKGGDSSSASTNDKVADSSKKEASGKSDSLKQAKPKGCGTTCGCG